MGITLPTLSRYAPTYCRRNDSAFLTSYTTTVALSGTNANTRVWGYRIYPNTEYPIWKYSLYNGATAYTQSAGTGAIKVAIYQVDSDGLPTQKLIGSDASSNIAAGATYKSTLFTPTQAVEMPIPLEPLLICWVSNLNSVTITNGGTFNSSVPINITDMSHPYGLSGNAYGLDLEITVPSFTYSSFTFPNSFSELLPSAYTPRNSNNMCNVDWILSYIK